MSKSILWDHHVIPENFEGHPVIKLLGGETLIQSPRNRIYLPSDQRLATQMGLSPHPGGPIKAYPERIKFFLDGLGKSPDFAAAMSGTGDADAAKNRLATRFNAFQDTVKVGLINGDILTNAPLGMTPEDANSQTDEYLTNPERYAEEHKGQIARANRLQRRFDKEGIGHTGKFMSLLTSDRLTAGEKIAALEEYLERNKNIALTSTTDRGSLDYFKHFLEGDTNGDSFTPLRPDEVPQLKGRPIQYLDLWNPGFPATPRRPTILGTPPIDPKDIPYPAGFPKGPTFPDLPPSTSGPQVPTVYVDQRDDPVDTIVSDKALFAAIAALAGPLEIPALLRLLAARGAGAELGALGSSLARSLGPAAPAGAANVGGAALSPALLPYLAAMGGSTMLATPAPAADVGSQDPTPQEITNEGFKASREPEEWKPQDPASVSPDLAAPNTRLQKSESAPQQESSDFVNPLAPDQGRSDAGAPALTPTPFGMLSGLTFDPVAQRWVSPAERFSQIMMPQPEKGTSSGSRSAWPGLLFRTDWPANSDAGRWDGTSAPDYWTLPPST